MSLSDIHSDIIHTHILPKLDGPSLTSVAATSSNLLSLCTEEQLWKDICHSTWPSLTDPRVSNVVSTFPSAHRSFYHDSFPILHPTSDPDGPCLEGAPATSELISAVDIRYMDRVVYSRVEVTDTTTDEFLSPPLWIELVEDKPADQPGFSRVNFEEKEMEFLDELEKNVTLNWVIINPARKRSGNFSSVRPIFARRHWMTNEVTMRFVTILDGSGGGSSEEKVQCRIEVTCGGKEGGELHVSEVVMQLHDMDSKCLTGEECLLTIQRAMGGGRRKLGSRGEEKVKYEEFLKLRRERREKRERIEKRNAKVNRIMQLSVFVLGLVYVSELLFC